MIIASQQLPVIDIRALPKTRLESIQWYADKLTTAAALSPEKYDMTECMLAKSDLFYLLVKILNRKDANHDWLFDRCREVQKNPNDYLDLWARGHYKSTIQTYAMTIMDLLRNPNLTVGIFSHTRPIAKAFLSQIKREFEGNQRLKDLFHDILYAEPHKDSPLWSLDGGIIIKRSSNQKEATIEAWGLVDGQPTSKHFDILLYDDVVTAESVSTPDQVEKTTERWELSLNLGASNSVKRHIGTRYHLRDSYAIMLERKAVKPRLYAATTNGRMDGKPVLLSQKDWDGKIRDMSRRTLAAQLLQNPLADEDATFRPSWLRPYDVRPKTLNVYIMADPSKGRSATSDNTAIAVVGIASNGAKFLLDGYCHRMGLSERWTCLRDLYKKWSVMPGVMHIDVGYERYGAQSDDEYFAERQLKEKIHFRIRELNWTRDGTKSKRDRVERLEPDFRNSRVFLPIAVWRDGPCVWSFDDNKDSKTFGTIQYREVDGLTKAQQQALDGGSAEMIARAIKRRDEDGKFYDLTLRLIEEYGEFPYGVHDDLIDAVSRIYDMEPVPPAKFDKSATEPQTFFDS